MSTVSRKFVKVRQISTNLNKFSTKKGDAMDTTVFQIKSRTAALGLKSLDIINALRERGITVSPQQYSSSITGYTINPKSLKITSTANEILTELEAKKK